MDPEEAYAEGVEYALAGGFAISNPYDPDRDPEAHQAWLDGFNSDGE
jgi:hypothetical protein